VKLLDEDSKTVKVFLWDWQMQWTGIDRWGEFWRPWDTTRGVNPKREGYSLRIPANVCWSLQFIVCPQIVQQIPSLQGGKNAFGTPEKHTKDN